MRFSLRGLLGLVCFVSIVIAMMVHPYYYTRVALSLSIGSIVLAMLVGVASRGRFRIMSICYAIAASTHLVLALGPGLENSVGELLITRQGVDWMFVALDYGGERISSTNGIWGYFHSFYPPGDRKFHSYVSLVIVGQSILSVVLGLIGALIGGFIYNKRVKKIPT